MTDQTAIDAATRRLTQALDALDAAVERRLEAERGEAQLADQVHALGADRARLAVGTRQSRPPARASSKPPTARSRGGSMRRSTTSARSSRRRTGEDMRGRLGLSERHHQRPPVPHGLRGRAGGASREARQGFRRAASPTCAARFGEVGDARLTIMAALTMADELSETMKKLRQVEAELPALQDAQVLCRRPRPGDAGRRRRGVQCRRRAPRGRRQEAQPVGGRPGLGARLDGGAGAPRADYIGPAGLPGAFGDNSPGPYDPEGSCPWLDPWVRLYGAHLLL